jgi:hypothetical protein
MNAVFTGRKRSGKTTLAFHFALERDGGIIVYDPKREWRDWPYTTHDVAQVVKFIKEGHERVIVFQPTGDKQEAFAPLADLVVALHAQALANGWDKAGYHFTFLVDEAHNVTDAHFVDKNVRSLVSENRPEILDVYLTLQNPLEINNSLKSGGRFSDYFIFNTSLAADLDYLRDKFGVPDADLEQIKTLRPHEYAHFHFEGGAPQVTFHYDDEAVMWYRPLDFTEIDQQEKENITMPRDSRERRNTDRRDPRQRLQDLVDDLGHGDDFEVVERRPARRERDDRGRGERERDYSRPYRD